MPGEETSADGPIHIYSSQQISPYDSHGQVQLEITIE